MSQRNDPRSRRNEPRGEFRPIYEVLLDDSDYQQLTAHARLVLLTAKVSLGAAGIGVQYAGQLAARTGLSDAEIETALAELVTADYVQRERNVLWVLNGLRFEPSMSPKRDTQRLHIQRRVAGLPRTTLTDAYRERYPEWFADAEPAPRSTDTLSDSLSDSPSHTPSPSLPIGYSGSGSGSGSGSPSLTKTGAVAQRGGVRAGNARPDAEPQEFAATWLAYPRRNGSNPRRSAARAFGAWLAKGVTAAAMQAGTERYRRWCAATGKIGTEKVMQGSRFFGPNREFDQSWDIPSVGPDESDSVYPERGPAEQERDRVEELAFQERERARRATPEYRAQAARLEAEHNDRLAARKATEQAAGQVDS